MLSHERAILTMLLAGDRPVLGALRDQLAQAQVTTRESTTCGFFTTFRVPEQVLRLRGAASLQIGDVGAEVSGLRHGAGFILFVRQGVVDFLEGFVYADDVWPKTPEFLRLFYTRHAAPRSPQIVESGYRDLSWADRFEAG